MDNPATTSDVESRWRPLSQQEDTNAATFLDDAWRMLTRRIPTLESAAESDVDLTAEIVRVMASAVVRVMKNPDGKSREAIDDYSWARDQAVSAGFLYFTDDDLGDLSPTSVAATGAFTIKPRNAPGCHPLAECLDSW